ncbi:MAG: FAD-dependent monooxygenase [Gammaproteobacteria bacterium]|nr:FAD-dependent monooxygenase [Gammaproteobacteria bacterium]
MLIAWFHHCSQIVFRELILTHQIIISGAGIAGLTAALALHAHGFDRIVILERAHDIQPLGSGINLLPHAVRELDALDILDDLIPLCIQTKELFYMNHRGDRIWHEVRGTDAGYRWPQLSIHRGWLQNQLYQKVVSLLGANAVRTGMEVVNVQSSGRRAIAICKKRSTGETVNFEGDLVIGADGIRSSVRRVIVPAEGPPPCNGMVIFRGATWGSSFLTGRSMIIAGDGVRKIVLYPMAHRTDSDQVLLNWAAAVPENPGAGYSHGDWNIPVAPSKFAPEFEGWNLAGVQPSVLMQNSPDTFVYPMVDREPLKSWSKNGNIVLIGDAAHAMYPVGSNGATQSIIDASAIAYYLGRYPRLIDALSAYEADRQVKMTKLQLANRQQGPEVVINIANERAPNGFDDPENVFKPGELQEISDRYTKTSSMEFSKVNEPSPYMCMVM